MLIAFDGGDGVKNPEVFSNTKSGYKKLNYTENGDDPSVAIINSYYRKYSGGFNSTPMIFETSIIGVIGSSDDYIVQFPLSAVSGSINYRQVPFAQVDTNTILTASFSWYGKKFTFPIMASNRQYVFIIQRKNGETKLTVVNTQNSSDKTNHKIHGESTSNTQSTDDFNKASVQLKGIGTSSQYLGNCTIDGISGVSFDLRYFMLYHNKTLYGLFDRNEIEDHILFEID